MQHVCVLVQLYLLKRKQQKIKEKSSSFHNVTSLSNCWEQLNK